MLAQCYGVQKNQVKNRFRKTRTQTLDSRARHVGSYLPVIRTEPGGLMAAGQFFVTPDGQPWFGHWAGSSCRGVLPPVLDSTSSRTSVGRFLSPSHLLILAMPLFIHITVGGVPFRLITVIPLFVQKTLVVSRAHEFRSEYNPFLPPGSVGILVDHCPPSENSMDIRVG